jgi:orotidine-5'-phosphate decarboxylase
MRGILRKEAAPMSISVVSSQKVADKLPQALVDKPIVVALDFSEASKAEEMAAQLSPKDCRLKVGKELFTAAGPALVDRLQRKGFEVFLDLKFHDIPNTCAKAVAAAAGLGVWMVNVHASGGEAMLAAAADACAHFAKPPLLIGVTLLTSSGESELKRLGIARSPLEQVLHLAAWVKAAGLSGVVCSAWEAEALKTAYGPEFRLVTPGIRPLGAEQNDQHRIMTPRQALAAGSDYLVIGRPITQALDPAAACQAILADLRADQ